MKVWTLTWVWACSKPDSGVESADPTGETGLPSETDPVGETDSEPTRAVPHLLDDDHVLVLPNGDGVSLFGADGAEQITWYWDDLIDGCSGCTGEGASADGDGLLASFATGGAPSAGPPPGEGDLDGGFVRIHQGGLDFALESGLSFPHDAVRDPFDDTILVPEAFGDRLVWVEGDGSSDDPVRVLDVYEAAPNGLHLVEDAGERFALFSNRGASGPPGGGGGGGASGRVSLWDITDPDAPSMQWVYPEEGALDTPHGPLLRRVDGAWYLLYAHSYGAGDGGSIGVATTADPRTPPTYLADLVPGEGFDFLRGVELTDDMQIIATDSGPEGDLGDAGAVWVGSLPELTATGATGVAGEDQVFVDWDGTILISGLANPFEGWLWAPTFTW